MTISIPLKNSGARDGEEVVQVYVRRLDDTEGPARSLRAYKRVPLKAGESEMVKITLGAEAFESFDTVSQRMKTMPGKYEIFYGPSSDTSRLSSSQITLK